VVLVVAADDGCKEQTVDSLACAKLAGAPVVVAVNKMDVEGADAQRVEGELMSYDLVPESAGGDTLVARVSAKEKTGLDELLEKVLLQADLLDLRANPDRAATGTVIEAGVEKGPYLRVP
jgi:translation initiation factor IF-2